MVATAGTDGNVNVWDFSAESPQQVSSKPMKVGELFTCEFYEDSPSILACGGSNGELAVWDVFENK